MAGRDRFALALNMLKSTDWAAFENLCNSFLASEFPSLRSTASANGDGGRDGELFVTDQAPTIAFQYSVSKDWKSKIRKTIKRIKETRPHTTILRYLTNQEIGAQADTIKAELLQEGIVLDVCDSSWFLGHVDKLRSHRRAAAM